MKRCCCSFLAVLVCCLVNLGSPLQAAVVTAGVTSPPGSSLEGNSDNVFPFFNPRGPMRYQQVYGSSVFAGLAAGGESITEIRFRLDSTFGYAFATTIDEVAISLSTTSAGPDALSTSNLDSNLGGDVLTVLPRGALSLASAAIGGDPHAFDILIPLTSPFHYDPANGHLLLEIRNYSGRFIASDLGLDAQELVGDAVSRVYHSGNADGNTHTGSRPTVGLVTQFITVVPEPSPVVLLLGGCLLGLWLRRRD